MYPLRSVFILSLLGFVSAWEQTSGAELERLEESAFGKMPDGMAVRLFTLRNAQGMTAKVVTYGAIVTELRVPDRQGALTNVVLGTDNLEQYLKRFPAPAARTLPSASKASAKPDSPTWMR